MTYRVRNLGIAGALAVAAVVLIASYLTNYKRHVQKQEQAVTVYVATREIPAGTPASDVLSSSFMHKTTVLQRSVVPGFVSDPGQIEGLYVTQPIFTNDQVSLAHFAKANARGVHGQLSGTDRAIEIVGTPSQLLAGTLQRSDRVDVVAPWESPAASQHYVSKVILRDLLVLSAPSSGALKGTIGSSNGTMSVQLRLSDAQAASLAYADVKGDWTLVLRPPLHATDGRKYLDDAVSIAKRGLGAKAYDAGSGGQK